MKHVHANWLLRAGLGLLLLSLSCGPSGWGWALANRRDHPLDVIVRKTPFCDMDADLSDESNYGPPERVRVRAQDYIGLNELREPGGSFDTSCGAAWVQIEEFEGVLVWSSMPSWGYDADPIPYSVIVEGPLGHAVVHLPAGVGLRPVPQ